MKPRFCSHGDALTELNLKQTQSFALWNSFPQFHRSCGILSLRFFCCCSDHFEKYSDYRTHFHELGKLSRLSKVGLKSLAVTTLDLFYAMTLAGNALPRFEIQSLIAKTRYFSMIHCLCISFPCSFFLIYIVLNQSSCLHSLNSPPDKIAVNISLSFFLFMFSSQDHKYFIQRKKSDHNNNKLRKKLESRLLWP